MPDTRISNKSFKSWLSLVFLTACISLWGQEDTAKGYRNPDKMGGPKSIGRLMEVDNTPKVFEYRYPIKVLKSWYDMKSRINKNTGIQFNINYTSLYIHSTEVITSDNQSGAGSGILDLQFGWTLLGRKSGKNTGTLFFKLNSRHAYNSVGVIPMFHGLTESGYYGLPATGYNNYTFRALELNWQQNLFEDKLGITIGKVDLTNYFNFHGLIIPWQHFIGFGSSVSGSMNWGNQGLGAVINYRVNDHWYVLGGLVDTYGDQFQNGDLLDFGRHWQDGKFQYNAEIGWVASPDERYYKKISLTFYKAPAYTSFSSGAEIASGQGMAFSAHWFFRETFAPYFRFGVSNGVGENNFYSADIQVGNGILFKNYDMLGTGFSWNQPNIPGVKDQYTAEIFYRIKLSAHLELTPSVQFITNPTLNTAVNSLFYFGARARATL